jgi:4-hydroxyacetophenone monooxygenase
MDLYADLPLGDEKDHFFRGDYEELFEELAYEDFPRDVHWTNGPPPNLSEWKIMIVEAAISGIAVAVLIKRLGNPFEVVERQPGCGGTWLLNSYPNVRVDSPSYRYQFRFTKKYKWSEYFASGRELKKYLEYVAIEFDILEHMKSNREIIDAQWDEVESKWNTIMKQQDGIEEKLQYNAIISASGLFSTPNLPVFQISTAPPPSKT